MFSKRPREKKEKKKKIRMRAKKRKKEKVNKGIALFFVFSGVLRPLRAKKKDRENNLAGPFCLKKEKKKTIWYKISSEFDFLF